MNHFISGIIKIVLIEAQVALLLFDRVLEDRYPKHRRNAFVVLAGLMVFAWCNYGGLRGGGSIVHGWEQFHFYLGAKYQKEVGWFDLYKAALIADRESAHALQQLDKIRDIATFELISVDEALRDAGRVRARFSDERWAEFLMDWQRLVQRPGNWGAVLQDHGNSNSPAWAVIAHPIASVVPLTSGGQTFLGLIDVALMAVLWWFVFKSFGAKAASVGLFLWAVPPIVFDYLAGSFLRWDWLFALGMAICLMKRERWLGAGAFFGYAVATKLFPIFFGLALLGRAALTVWQQRVIPRRYVQFLAGAAASGLFFVAAAAVMFGSVDVWKDYKARIDVARVEKFYGIQYSLRTVYLQVAESKGAEVLTEGLWPRELKQARADVDIAQHALPFFLVKLLFTALVLVLAVRASDLEAFTLGPLLVFTWLVVNMYYWNMLGLTALGLFLRKDRAPFAALVGLHGLFGFFYLYQHTNHGFSEGFAVAALLALGLVAAAVFELHALSGQWMDLLYPVRAPAPGPSEKRRKAR